MNYINEPRVIKRLTYEACRERFADRAMRQAGVVAVYTAGSVSVPGISDLDFVVCLDDSWRGDFAAEDQSDKELNYLMAGGSVLKVNRSAFSDIKIIDDFDLQHVAGEEFAFADFDSAEFELCRVMDWLPERLHSLVQLRFNESLDVRRALLLLKSLTVSLTKLDSLTQDASYTEFTRGVLELRETWFDNPSRLGDLTSMLDSAVQSTIIALNATARYADETRQLLAHDDFAYRTATFSIVGGPQFEFATAAAVRGGRVVLPWAWLVFFAAQAVLPRGILSDMLIRSFTEHPARYLMTNHLGQKLSDTVRNRVDYCNGVAAFLRAGGVKTGLLKYGWLL